MDVCAYWKIFSIEFEKNGVRVKISNSQILEWLIFLI